MIGNDIVDLKQSISNWKRPRFLDKVFTQNEQQLICSSEDQHQMVWWLWSMKEAAYKCHVQQFDERFFNPKRLLCQLISEGKGSVSIDAHSYVTASTITEDYIYTVASQEMLSAINTGIYKSEITTYNNQSTALKEEVLKSISQTKQLDVQALSIKKTASGIPRLYINSERQPIALSLTHCGRFSGYAYALATVNY